jgi:hypothetical protein
VPHENVCKSDVHIKLGSRIALAYSLVLSIFNNIVHGKGACRVGIKIYDWLFRIEKGKPSGQVG